MEKGGTARGRARMCATSEAATGGKVSNGCLICDSDQVRFR